MKNLVFLLLLLPLTTLSQHRQYKFFSEYQVDKTYNGSKKVGTRKATILLNDPKPVTPAGETEFSRLPKGSFTVIYEGLNPIKETIVYMGSTSQGSDAYIITNSKTDRNIIYVIKSPQKAGSKNYSYTIIWGKTQGDELQSFEAFTAYYCSMMK